MGVSATIVQVGDNTTLYGLLLLLHILCAIVGFGGVMLNGLYGAEAGKRQGPGGVAVGEANFAVSKIAEIFIYGVFVFGILMVVAANDNTVEWGQTWIWLSILLYVVGIGFSHGVQLPNAKRMNALAAELVAAGPPPEGAQGPPPQVAEMEATGKKLAMGGMFLNLLVVTILVLMIWKPGLDF